MKQFDIADLQKKRDNYRYLAHHSPTEENWAKFRHTRNKITNQRNKNSLLQKNIIFQKTVKKYGK